MKIFDSTKTYELSEYQIDTNKGYLKPDKKFVMHHDAVEGKEAEWGDRIEELPNGSKLNWKDVLISPAIEAKEAYDEYEDIQVYVLYTEEELKDIKRSKRVHLLEAFDKWEKAVLRGREQDDYSIMSWYNDLKDLQDSAFENIPARIEYYL